MKKKKNEEIKKFGGPGKIALVNSITGIRFIGAFLTIPVFQALGGVAAAIYAGSFMLTDWIDGKLARSFNVSTFFGSMFDGATDKAFVVLTFALLLAFNPVLFAIPLLIELGIIAVQNKKVKDGLNIKSNFIGKVKTWVLSTSMVASLATVDLLNIKPVLDYVKTTSLSKVADIKDILILLGVNMPGIIFQLLTLRSYSKELKEGKDLKKQNEEQLIKNKEEVKHPEEKLNDIARKKEELQREYSLLEKAKIFGSALFDPAYYEENKDRQIKVLARELLKKEK